MYHGRRPAIEPEDAMWRKARQAVGAVLEEIAPQQSAHLWKTLVFFKSLEAQDSSSDTEDGDVDQVLMVALAECYMNAGTWQARRQILSIVADKLQLHTVRRWIPDLTRYRFTTAREHAIRYGRGVPPEPQVHAKMFVSQTQVDHFLDFITSPHVIQDLPFGERSLTLSTKRSHISAKCCAHADTRIHSQAIFGL